MTTGGSYFRVRLRSAGQPDLPVTVTHGTARLEWSRDDGAAADAPALDLDPFARHLVIWGGPTGTGW